MFRSRHRILLPGTPSEEFSVGSATRRRRSGAMAQATQCLAEPPLRRGFCRRWQRGGCYAVGSALAPNAKKRIIL
jgi:hypothetical protein